MFERETARFASSNPRSRDLASRARAHLPNGVPMHWMTDWATPFALFVASASGASLKDVDGHAYADFCLGDTGTMFGHVPPPVAKAVEKRLALGFSAMLSSEDGVVAAENLAARFGLPFWQIATTATDANRFVLRWARAITGRPVVLVFNGCYHGSVDDTFLRLEKGKTVLRPGVLGAYDFLEPVAYLVFGPAQLAEELLQGFKASGATESKLQAYRHAYAISGWKGVTRKSMEESVAEWKRDPWHRSAFEIACHYADFGDKEQALQWLGKAYDAHSGMLIWLKTQPQLDSLRADPRFQDLLRQVGFSLISRRIGSEHATAPHRV